MVLQSANVSSSTELELSLFTITTLSAKLMPALSKSSRLKEKKILSCKIISNANGSADHE